MYQNKATALTQALVIFLLDVSGSMGKPMPGGESRIHVVREALKTTITEMVQRSLRNKELRPRYRVAMIAYSDDVYDLLSGVKTIDFVAKKGYPKLEPLNKTDTTKGFLYVKNLLEQEINSVTQDCPAPLVIHMTDGEYTSKDDPEPIVREIQKIMVPDGNVLVENVFISDELKVSIPDAAAWPGYKSNEDTGSKYGNHLLSMSSPLPELYREVMVEMEYSIQNGTVMMYPGVRPEFVQMAFVMSTASRGTAKTENSWDRDK